MNRLRRGDSLRALAAECREKAGNAATEAEAADWLNVARTWLRIARDVDAMKGPQAGTKH
jgi:hypothetical protein